MPNTAWTRRGGSEERRASVRALFLIVISVLFVTLPALTTVGAAATNSDAADEAIADLAVDPKIEGGVRCAGGGS